MSERAPAFTGQEMARLSGLVGRYCPVDSLMRAAVPDYHVRWERLS